MTFEKKLCLGHGKRTCRLINALGPALFSELCNEGLLIA